MDHHSAIHGRPAGTQVPHCHGRDKGGSGSNMSTSGSALFSCCCPLHMLHHLLPLGIAIDIYCQLFITVLICFLEERQQSSWFRFFITASLVWNKKDPLCDVLSYLELNFFTVDGIVTQKYCILVHLVKSPKQQGKEREREKKCHEHVIWKIWNECTLYK